MSRTTGLTRAALVASLLTPLMPAGADQAAPATADAAAGGFGLRMSALVAAPWGPGQQRSSRLALEPRWQGRLDQTWELRAALRLRRIEQQGVEDKRAEWRELSLGWRRAEMSLTLGAQQLNWGRMDIVRLTDAVNAVDQQDLFVEELPESKTALWMLNAEWQGQGRSWQLVVAPQVPVDRLPARIEGLPVQVSAPGPSLRHATVALRHGFETGAWTGDAVVLHGWQTLPALRPEPTATGAILRGQPQRLSGIGGSADRPIGAVVLRVEGWAARVAAAEDRAVTGPAAPAATASVVPKARLAALGAGLDLRHGDWFGAVQAIALRRSSDSPLSGEAQRSLVASAIVQHKWLQDRLAARLSHIRESAQGSSWTSLQVSYELTANVLLRAQADRFDGEAGSTFGAYGARSRVAFAIKASY